MDTKDESFIIDRDAVIQEAKKISNPSNQEECAKIIELLGGDRLKLVFESQEISTIIRILKEQGAFYEFEGENFDMDILEGLINGQVKGNLANFLMIKFDYVKSLPIEQKIKLAQSFSGGVKPLEDLLVNLWDMGIETDACSGGNTEQTYVAMHIPLGDRENIDRVMESIRENKIQYEMYAETSGFYEEKKLSVTIRGEGTSMYTDFNEGLKKKPEFPGFYSSFMDEFESQYQEGFDYSRHEQGPTFSSAEVEALLEENLGYAQQRIADLERQLEEAKKAKFELEARQAIINGRYRDFLVNKLGKVPHVRLAVLKSLREYKNELKHENRDVQQQPDDDEYDKS